MPLINQLNDNRDRQQRRPERDRWRRGGWVDKNLSLSINPDLDFVVVSVSFEQTQKERIK